jgi:hypothetical protein
MGGICSAKGRGQIHRNTFLKTFQYENGVWKPIKLWNGDETDPDLCFYDRPAAVRVRLERF